MNQKRADELIQEIGSAIVEDPAIADLEWDSVAVVAHLDGGFSLFGYLYREGENEPFSPEDDELFELFPELQDAMAEGEEHRWKACLYTIAKPDMDVDVDFEFDDASRWRVTPDNIDTMPEQLRPR